MLRRCPFTPNAMNDQAMPVTPIERIADRYAFPRGLSGSGECVGILAFGGGIYPCDLARYFRQQTGGTVPDLRFQNIMSTNRPNVDSQHDKELALDIQLVGGLAPGARIVTYFSTNDEKGWAEALSRAIHDDENKPSVLSISWGATEDRWTKTAIQTLTQLFEEAAKLGITVCAASGDEGCARDVNGHCRVTFPASSPFVLACGGTSVTANDREVVWKVRNKSASGGGISDLLDRPHWQSPPSRDAGPSLPCRRNPHFDGRQLPDVSALASYSYSVYAGGRYRNGVGGTSAAAPLWSALIARLNEGLKHRGRCPVGYLNPLLYKDRSIQNTFRNVASGHNDPFGNAGYRAQPGWDACTGWGTPNGTSLLAELIRRIP
jgi:kumamolisin